MNTKYTATLTSVPSDQPCLEAILGTALKCVSGPEVVLELVIKFPALAGVEGVPDLVGFLHGGSQQKQ